MNTIHLALVSLLVERDDVDATNAIQLLTNAETNVLNELLAPGSMITPTYRHQLLNTPSPDSQIDSLITYASQNGAKDIFKS